MMIKHISQIAAKGELTEFQRLYEEDNARLEIKDTKGLSPIHHATLNGHLSIVEFIISHDGGQCPFSICITST